MSKAEVSAELYNRTVRLVDCFMRSDFKTTVFICKTNKRADALMEEILKMRLPIEVSLMSTPDQRPGICIKKIIH